MFYMNFLRFVSMLLLTKDKTICNILWNKNRYFRLNIPFFPCLRDTMTLVMNHHFLCCSLNAGTQGICSIVWHCFHNIAKPLFILTSCKNTIPIAFLTTRNPATWLLNKRKVGKKFAMVRKDMWNIRIRKLCFLQTNHIIVRNFTANFTYPCELLLERIFPTAHSYVIFSS